MDISVPTQHPLVITFFCSYS